MTRKPEQQSGRSKVRHHQRSMRPRSSGNGGQALAHWSFASFSGLVAAGFASTTYLVLRWSHATSPGNLIHQAATSQLQTKLTSTALAPIVAISLAGLGVIGLWLASSVIFIYSKRYDNRPIKGVIALRAGANAIGSLAGLGLIGLVGGLAWISALVLAIKLIGHYSLVYWLSATLGVAASFMILLLGLWLMATLVLAAHIAVLSGQGFAKSFSQGFRMASKDYAYVASTGLGLLVVLVATKVTIILGFIVLGRLTDSTWLIAAGGSVLATGLIAWFTNLWLQHWLKRYRVAAIRVFGQSNAALYLAGRHPKKISHLGIILAIIWWLAVAGGASWALWHFKVDPTGLLNKLAASIY